MKKKIKSIKLKYKCFNLCIVFPSPVRCRSGFSSSTCHYYYYIFSVLYGFFLHLSLSNNVIFSLRFFTDAGDWRVDFRSKSTTIAKMLFSFQQEQLPPPKRNNLLALYIIRRIARREIKSLFILVNKFKKKKK